MKKGEWQNWINLILGAGLFIMPWSLDHKLLVTNAKLINYNFWATGLILFFSASLAIKDLKLWEEWVNIILGIWIMLSPWVLGYVTESGLMLNSIILGLAISVLAGMTFINVRKHQHHS